MDFTTFLGLDLTGMPLLLQWLIAAVASTFFLGIMGFIFVVFLGLRTCLWILGIEGVSVVISHALYHRFGVQPPFQGNEPLAYLLLLPSLVAAFFLIAFTKSFVGATAASLRSGSKGKVHYGFWRRFVSGLRRTFYRRRKLQRRTWQSIKQFAELLDFRYKPASDPEDWEHWRGLLMGKYRGHRVRIGDCDDTLGVELVFGRNLPRFNISNRVMWNDEENFRSGLRSFDRFFRNRCARSQALQRLLASPEVFETTMRLPARWGRTGLTIEADNGPGRIFFADDDEDVFPFYPFLPAEYVLLLEPEEIMQAATQLLDDLVELAEAYEQVLGARRYRGVPKQERRRLERLDRKLLEALEEDDEDARERVASILDQGADVNARNDDNQTALMIASQGEDPELVKLLIEHGADLDARNGDGESALHLAAAEGRAQAIELLAAAGADSTMVDKCQRTPLISAVESECDDITVIEALVKAGVDINAVDDEGRTALSLAEENEMQQLVATLKKLGATR